MQPDYVRQYHDQGYAIIRGVFQPAEISALAEAFDRIYDQGLAYGASYRDGNVCYRLAQDPDLGQIVRIVQWPSYFDQVLARFRTHPRLLQILEPLLGRNLKQIINQLHWKPPGAANVEFAYHQDIRSRRPREAYRDPARSYVQTGIAVDAHRPDNGGMIVLPGSHKAGERQLRTNTTADRTMDRQLADTDLLAMGLNPDDKLELVLEPGDLMLWHLYLVHGSGPNLSAADRRFHINGYVIADNCDRGEWAFRDGQPCTLGEPVMVHYEELFTQPGPCYI